MILFCCPYLAINLIIIANENLSRSTAKIASLVDVLWLARVDADDEGMLIVAVLGLE